MPPNTLPTMPQTPDVGGMYGGYPPAAQAQVVADDVDIFEDAGREYDPANAAAVQVGVHGAGAGGSYFHAGAYD